MAQGDRAAGADAGTGTRVSPADADAWVRQIADDYRHAQLIAVDRALCDYARKLTTTPGAMTQPDVATLRAVGLDDVAINDAAQVVAYFNYINRIADGLGVDPEPDMR